MVNVEWREKKKEKVGPEFDSYVNHLVAFLMKAMGYISRTRLGIKSNGIIELPNLHCQRDRQGLVYKEGPEKFPKNEKTLNGNFIKEGKTFPYCGFLKP